MSTLPQKESLCKVSPIRPDLQDALDHALVTLKEIDLAPLKQTVTVPEPLLRQLENLQESICLKHCGTRSEICLWCYLDQFMERLVVLR